MCSKEMRTEEIVIHGVRVPIFGCDSCKSKYVLKKELDQKSHEVRAQLEAWMKEHNAKTI